MNWLRFGNPDFFFILWIGLPLIVLSLLYGLQKKWKTLLLFQSNVNPIHLKRFRIQVLLLGLCFLFVSIAILHPQWGVKPETVAERLDIMLALDISTSMLATDENATRRLTNAKDTIQTLLNQLEGDRIGLLYFAEASIVVCPLTPDVSTPREILSAITPETLVHRGTNISNAIETATDRFISEQNDFMTSNTNSGGHKVVVLFTDGEDHGDDAIVTASAAREKGIHLYCVGIGTPDKSVPIPLADESMGYKRDVNGQLVLTMLNEDYLKALVEAGGGNYYHINDGIAELRKDLAQLEKQKYSTSSDGDFQERFQLFTGLALILLIGEFLIQTTIKNKVRMKNHSKV